MKDLPRRTLTAAVYAVAVVAAIVAPPIVFWILLAVVGVLGLFELRGLRTGRPSIALAIVFFAGLAGLGVLRSMGTFAAEHGTPELPAWLLVALLPTWSADVAAYFIGSLLGRRRLAPTISPGKTWEGTIAGWIACGLAVIAVASVFGMPRVPLLAIAVGLGPIGLAGDLLESYVKRRAGVKDSGTMLPGHGGVLDRLDSLTAGAVFIILVVAAFDISQLGHEGGLFDRF
jgi:phosphatidate cytidylyltransferase